MFACSLRKVQNIARGVLLNKRPFFIQENGFKQLIVKRQSPDFRFAVEVEEVELRKPSSQEVLVKNIYVGINASDINYSAGRYDPSVRPPYGVGFESLGVVEDVGEGSRFKKGQSVAFFGTPARAFSEYIYTSDKELIPLPEVRPEFVNLMTVGMTAAIGLDEVGIDFALTTTNTSFHTQVGRVKKGDTVLITAAAGGVGHIAVQWAKAKGCQVIGTCSSDSKKLELEKIGCDHVINYQNEDIKTSLSKNFPKGMDVIWDTVGGSLTETFVNALAVKGRLVIVGAISGYKDDGGSGFPLVNIPDLPLKLLYKSRVMAGFFLPDYAKEMKPYFMQLLQQYSNKELKLWYDDGSKSDKGKFKGIEGIFRAVDHLHSKRNVGKVVAEL